MYTGPVLLTVAFQVVWKKAVMVDWRARWYGQRARRIWGCQIVCHKALALYQSHCQGPSQRCSQASCQTLTQAGIQACSQTLGLQQVNPFQWPLLSVFNSSRSNIPTRKSGKPIPQ